MERGELIILFVFILIGLAMVADAKGHYKPGSHNAIHAIQLVWCGKSNRECANGNNAIRVARCEASPRYWPTRPQEAVNGQYRGMFQMGSWERRTYGHGPSVWHQARAAYRYWKALGANRWSPTWECATIMGIR